MDGSSTTRNVQLTGLIYKRTIMLVTPTRGEIVTEAQNDVHMRRNKSSYGFVEECDRKHDVIANAESEAKTTIVGVAEVWWCAMDVPLQEQVRNNTKALQKHIRDAQRICTCGINHPSTFPLSGGALPDREAVEARKGRWSRGTARIHPEGSP